MITATAECGWRSKTRGRRPRRPELAPTTLLPTLCRRELLAVADGLALTAQNWAADTEITTRCWKLMAASATFEAWVIGWPPGGTIDLHDHGDSAGAVVVAGGELVETSVVELPDGTLTTATRRTAAGDSWTMDRRHVHDIVNDGPGPAVSVHVYAPRLTSMTNYQLDDGHLRRGATTRYRLGAVVP